MAAAGTWIMQMSDERGTSDDSTRFTARPGASDETRFTGVGAPPPSGGPAHVTFPPGSLIGHTYRIEALLARGGMGEVYRARHAELNTDHALKIILPELANNQRIVDLFRREASVLRTIRHDAVVAYDGVSRDENGRLYLVMEFVDGPSLSKLMGNRTFTAEEVRQLRDRLADGLAVAHDKGVIHRDISPDNVILPGGDVDKAKIIDFGISKMADPEQKTIVGDDFAGKFSYVSPEQLGMFGGQVDGRSDIYSLGLVLAAAAQGEPLDMGLSPISVIEARRAVPDLSRVPAGVRADLAAMLQPDPAKRPQSMRELARPQEQRGGRRSTSSEPPRRSSATTPGAGRLGLIVGAVVVVLAAGGLGYWYWPDNTDGTSQQEKDDGQQGGVTSNGGVGGTTQQTDNTGQQGGATQSTGGSGETTQQTDSGGQQGGTTSNGGVSGTTQQTDNTGQQGGATTGGSGETTQQDSGGQQGGTTSNGGVSGTTQQTDNTGQQDGGTQSTGGSGATTQQTDSGGQQGGATTSNEGAAGSTQLVVLPQVPDVAKLRREAETAVGDLNCAGVVVDVSATGDMATSGYVASEADRTRLFTDLKALPQVGRVDNAVAVMTPPLCEALNVVRAEAAYDVDTAPRIDPGGAGGVYYEGQNLKLTITAKSEGYLYVDYVDAKNDPSYKPADPKEPDEYVIHLLPNDRWRNEVRHVRAGEKVVIGTLPDEMKTYVIQPPFGTYVIIAISSPERLFEPRAIQEPAADYLPALRDRLRAVAQRVGRDRVTASSTTIVFQPRQQ
jgi:serine/threonine protein kinase